ncbi:glycerate kinase type-2 family protein [Derxia lacustris]|uniref:glycerate kinase type-2 family protein n=1 Tax=Derxia lacustris TaxID=764842 RepID=UPI001F230963|nr:glycerate kinase [Derxia lacustris]
MLDMAINAAQPSRCLPPYLPTELPKGRFIVIGAGKAAASMAKAVEENWPGEVEGLVITRYGYAQPCDRIDVVEAGHPVPDDAGREAAQRMLKLVSNLTPDDVVLCLISGGGSALLTAPLEGITLKHKQELSRALLASGASISEMNCVRRHLSALKGGRLALACAPAKVINLLISDVPGDDPIDIASGPTVPDPTTCADAIGIVKRYGIRLPQPVWKVLETGRGESIKPGDPRLPQIETHIIARPQTSLEAAADLARAAGVTPVILGDSIEGEAREVGKAMAGIALQVVRYGQPVVKPCVLLSSGETTVTVRGAGKGGRNVEFLLSLGIALNGVQGVHALAADTDGIDGAGKSAGALLRPGTLAKARTLGIVPRDALHANDGHGFFGAVGDSIVTGPTMTNVNDFRAILVI